MKIVHSFCGLLLFGIALTSGQWMNAASGQTVQPSSEASDKTESEKSSQAKLANRSDESGWHVFRGDAGSSGVAKSKLPQDLDIHWQYKIPGGQGAFEGTAVIAKNSSDKKPIAYIGDMDGTLYALDLETGDLKWQKKLAFSFSSSPAYRDGRIYIGDIDGFFYCVDESGQLQWKFESGGEINSSPNFYQGQVLFGSQDTKLYLLDAKTGEKKWEHETPDQIRCSVTIAGDRAFVAGCDGFFHIVDLKSGKELGKVDIRSPTQSTPAVLGDFVYVGTEQDAFMAINWKTIEGIWSFADPEGQSSVRGSAAVSKNSVIFGARNRQVYSVDPKSGDLIWTTTLKAKVDGSPVIVGDRVYVGSTDGRFYVLSLDKGEKLWEKQFNGSFFGSPAVAFERLVIATDRGVVYCLGKKETK